MLRCFRPVQRTLYKGSFPGGGGNGLRLGRITLQTPSRVQTPAPFRSIPPPLSPLRRSSYFLASSGLIGFALYDNSSQKDSSQGSSSLSPSSSSSSPSPSSSYSFFDLDQLEEKCWRIAKTLETHFWNTKGATPVDIALMKSIVAINVGVFAMWRLAFFYNSPRAVDFMLKHFTLTWEGVTQQRRLTTLFTSGFSHTEFPHLIFNMLVICQFGFPLLKDLRGVRQEKGTERMLHIYGGSILMCSAASLMHKRIGISKGFPDSPGLGASGAAMGILASFSSIFPERSFSILGTFGPFSAQTLFLAVVAFDLFRSFSFNTRVSSAGHLGGALYGYLVYRFVILPDIEKQIKERRSKRIGGGW